jgi:uncharacterized membrane protein YfcA
VGGGIGLVSGLVGAGGAFMSVPFMTWCNVPMRQAVGTSAALGFPIALANTAGLRGRRLGLAPALPGAFGYLYLPALAIIAAAASMAMAPRGRARGASHRRGHGSSASSRCCCSAWRPTWPSSHARLITATPAGCWPA